MRTPPEPQPDKTLPAIRQALSHPRDRERFDAGLTVVVEKARGTGNWREIEEFTRTWRIIAWISRRDSADRQRFWDTTDDLRRKIERGEEIPGVPLIACRQRGEHSGAPGRMKQRRTRGLCQPR